MKDDWKDDVMSETYGPASDANLPRSMTHESIKALCELDPQLQKQYDKNYNIRPLADTLHTILSAIEALKPIAEGTHDDLDKCENEALEKAAKWHDAEIADIRQQARLANADGKKYCRMEARFHKQSARAIRSLKTKEQT